MRKKAFTLIELLVVIAIIAILAAILFPVFAKARESARRTQCLSNAKQISTGIAMYTQDYDEMYMPRWIHPGHWGYAVYPYIKNWGVFACPSNPSSKGIPLDGRAPCDWAYSKPLIDSMFGTAYPKVVQGFGMNSWIHNSPKSMAEIDAPADRILLSEQFANCHNDYAGNWWSPETYRDVGYAGHNASWNLVYHDGHVKNKKPTATVSSKLEWVLGMDDADPNKCPGTGQGDANSCRNLIRGMQMLEERWK